MPGTKAGGAKAAAKNKANDPDFYRKIGSLGGRKAVPKGFAKMSFKKRSDAGKKGGKRSSRRGVLNGEAKPKQYFYMDDSIVIKEKEERRRLAEEIRALEAEEDYYD